MNLQERMELAGQCLLAWLDPEKEFLPVGGYEVAHNVGRWWDAVLRLEDFIGFVIPAELEGAMLRNLQRLTDNPDGLLMNRTNTPRITDKAKINSHNFREAFMAFNVLVRYRQSAWARRGGHHLLETMTGVCVTTVILTLQNCVVGAESPSPMTHRIRKRNAMASSTAQPLLVAAWRRLFGFSRPRAMPWLLMWPSASYGIT